jgi:hypothetical protein
MWFEIIMAWLIFNALFAAVASLDFSATSSRRFGSED